jgi:putative restriction endonuclease
MSSALDSEIRVQTFLFLDALRAKYGETLPRQELERGFEFRGERVPLLAPNGIFSPRVLEGNPLSLTTVPTKPGRARPYEDKIEGNVIQYKYRGTDAAHRDNVGLRRAMASRTPLVYFHGLVPGMYYAAYPVFVVADDPVNLTFTIAVDERDAKIDVEPSRIAESTDAARREYVTRLTKQRMHQQGFRERVLLAYRQCCAVCKIKHRPLLDAAHIVPDREEQGEPVISNGLALCKIHHAAFDSNIIGIRPDLIIEVRQDVLIEIDGPMLLHGFQELHSKALVVLPSRSADRPGREFLEVRYKRFLEAS